MAQMSPSQSQKHTPRSRHCTTKVVSKRSAPPITLLFLFTPPSTSILAQFQTLTLPPVRPLKLLPLPGRRLPRPRQNPLPPPPPPLPKHLQGRPAFKRNPPLPNPPRAGDVHPGI